MISPKDFWNMRSQNYDEQVGPYYADAYEQTLALTLKYLRPEDRVLDFACGTGIVTLRVTPHVAQVRAIDISDQMARQAQEKVTAAGLTNVEVSQTELFDPCLEPGSFDAILACNVLCYVDNWDEVMERIRSLLKPGGMLLTATDCLGEKITKVGIQKFIKSHTGKMPFVAFFRMKQLEKKIADSGFTVLESENLFPAPPNLFVAGKLKP